MSERWAPVIGYEGLYEVSDQGRVRSLDRVNPANGHRWTGQEKTLRLRGGYPVVDLHARSRVRSREVHGLVLEAFVGPRPLGMECRHLDGDKRARDYVRDHPDAAIGEVADARFANLLPRDGVRS